MLHYLMVNLGQKRLKPTKLYRTKTQCNSA